jgi:hypothetical protein
MARMKFNKKQEKMIKASDWGGRPISRPDREAESPSLKLGNGARTPFKQKSRFSRGSWAFYNPSDYTTTDFAKFYVCCRDNSLTNI